MLQAVIPAGSRSLALSIRSSDRALILRHGHPALDRYHVALRGQSHVLDRDALAAAPAFLQSAPRSRRLSYRRCRDRMPDIGPVMMARGLASPLAVRSKTSSPLSVPTSSTLRTGSTTTPRALSSMVLGPRMTRSGATSPVAVPREHQNVFLVDDEDLVVDVIQVRCRDWGSRSACAGPG